jgi:microcystin-dependent protein
MSEPYIGEIRMFGGTFAPVGWALCNGSLLPINQYNSLYTLIGTTYGGNGVTNFAVPDLRSRVPMHPNHDHMLGMLGGSEIVTLNVGQLPAHTHVLQADSDNGTTSDPTNALWATSQATKEYLPGNKAGASMDSGALSATGDGLPHENMLPFLSVNFIIALSGTFPPRP